jgi:hypothetical protein
MIFFLPEQILSQDRVLNYNIMMSGGKVGSLAMVRHDSLSTTAIKINCHARKRIIFLYTLTENQEAYFDKGIMVRSSVYRKVNSSIKINQHTQFRGDHYVVNKGNSDQAIMLNGVSYNQTSLYFTEPTAIKQLYSDIYLTMLDIKKVSNGVYKLLLPDGNVNYYYYTDGVCSKVKIDRMLFSVEFVLVRP